MVGDLNWCLWVAPGLRGTLVLRLRCAARAAAAAPLMAPGSWRRGRWPRDARSERTENATVATSGGTTPGLPLELAVTASFFLSAEEDDEGVFGPLPPCPYNAAVPKGPAFSFLNYYRRDPDQEGIRRAQQNAAKARCWRKHLSRCEELGREPRLPEETYLPLLYSDPLPLLNRSLEQAHREDDLALRTQGGICLCARVGKRFYPGAAPRGARVGTTEGVGRCFPTAW